MIIEQSVYIKEDSEGNKPEHCTSWNSSVWSDHICVCVCIYIVQDSAPLKVKKKKI